MCSWRGLICLAVAVGAGVAAAHPVEVERPASRIGPVVVDGDDQRVNVVVQAASDAMFDCLSPTARPQGGWVSVELTYGPVGASSAVVASTTLNDAQTETCLTELVNGLAWPIQSEPTTVSIPVSFGEMWVNGALAPDCCDGGSDQTSVRRVLRGTMLGGQGLGAGGLGPSETTQASRPSPEPVQFGPGIVRATSPSVSGAWSVEHVDSVFQSQSDGVGRCAEAAATPIEGLVTFILSVTAEGSVSEIEVSRWPVLEDAEQRCLGEWGLGLEFASVETAGEVVYLMDFAANSSESEP